MGRVVRYVPVVLLGGVAVWCLWSAVSAFAAQSHFVCTEATAPSRKAPEGECLDGYTAEEPAPLPDRIARLLVIGTVGGMFALGAVYYYQGVAHQSKEPA